MIFASLAILGGLVGIVFVVARSRKLTGDFAQKKYAYSLALLLGSATVAVGVPASLGLVFPLWVFFASAMLMPLGAIGIMHVTTPTWKFRVIDDSMTVQGFMLMALTLLTVSLGADLTAEAVLSVVTADAMLIVAALMGRVARQRWSNLRLEAIVMGIYLGAAALATVLRMVATALGESQLHTPSVWVTGMAGLFCAIAMVIRTRAKHTTPHVDLGRARPAFESYAMLCAVSAVYIGALPFEPKLNHPVFITIAASIIVGVVARTVASLVMYESLITDSSASEQHYKDLVQNSNDVIILLDNRSSITYVSPAAEHILGVTPEETLDRSLHDILQMSRIEVRHNIHRVIEYRDTKRAEHEIGKKSLETAFSPSEQGVLVAIRDVTERESIRRELHNLAFQDSLTGLENRHSLLRELENSGNDQNTAILYLDLDNFKLINDTYGHEVGDEVLKEIARRLSAAAPANGTLGRVGGDEFVAIFPVSQSEAESIAESFRKVFTAPFWHNGVSHQLGGSVGLATGSSSRSAIALLREADAAMYAAKRRRTTTPDGADEPREAAQEHAPTPDAVGLFSLAVHDTGRDMVCSRQVAKHDAEGNVVLALPVSILRPAAQYATAQPTPTTVTIQFIHDGSSADAFVERVTSVLNESELAPEQLTISVACVASARQPLAAAELLSPLTSLGVKLQLEKFGAGNITVAVLLSEEYDFVRLDPRLVALAKTTSRATDTLRLAINTVRSAGMHAVASDVNSAEDHEFVCSLGFDLVTGSYYTDDSRRGTVITAKPIL